MASILSMGSRMFRTRNPARDANTDLDRFMTVRRSIASAIEGATRERDGLQRRLDVYYAQATSLLDNSPEFAERDSAEEEAIRQAEDNAAAASRRIKQITEHIAQLNKMLADVDAVLDGTDL
ncbi:hypothetical protein [Devosia geojensis]|nr:hypothetical protein [Devosia geojensis]